MLEIYGGAGMEVPNSALERLVGCKVFIESGHYHLNMGTIIFLGEDIFEVNIAEPNRIRAADPVKVIIYGPDGMIKFKTSIIAKYDHGIILLSPPEILQKTLQQRKHHRVPTRQSGFIRATATDAAEACDDTFQMTIHDIALGGIGFELNNGEDMPVKSSHSVEIILERLLRCRIEIVRKFPKEDVYHYGASFLDISECDSKALRSHILREQINRRTKGKAEILLA
jgi:c-di-GMP-binding flagellar brake protein YcgR